MSRENWTNNWGINVPISTEIVVSPGYLHVQFIKKLDWIKQSFLSPSYLDGDYEAIVSYVNLKMKVKKEKLTSK